MPTTRKKKRVETLTARATDPRHRRRGPRLSLFDRAARRDRRRHRHGVARRVPRLEHGIHAIPPDLPLQSGGQEFPDHRGGARRGRACSSNPQAPGERFMPRFDERAELAPRDIVARAIDSEIKRARPRLRPARHQRTASPSSSARISPTSTSGCSASASTSRASRSRSCRRSITPAAGCWWTSTGGPTRRGSMPPARSPSRACTAPTAWPPTPCSNAWCSAKRRRAHIAAQLGRARRRPPTIRAWDESRVTDSDEEVVIAQTWGEIRRFMWNYRRHRPDHQAARARQAPDRHAAPRGARLLRAISGSRPTSSNCATWSRSPTSSSARALSPPRKPRAALHARLSRHARGTEGHGAGAVIAIRARLAMNDFCEPQLAV